MSRSTFSPSKYETLRSLVVDNIEHFRNFEGKYSSKLFEIFSQFLDCLNVVEIEITDLSTIVHLFDLDADTPGNGYRSIISIIDTYLELSTSFFQKVIFKRANFNFSKKRYFRKLRSYTGILTGLLALLRISQMIRAKNQPGVLWSFYDDEFLKRVMTDIENVDRTWFYGKPFAFQYTESLRQSLRIVCLSTATYSHVFYGSGSKISRICSSLLHFCRYSHSSSKLSKRFVKVTYNAYVDFCKTFWNLQSVDIMKKLSNSVTDPLAVNKLIKLLPEPLHLSKDDGTIVDIPIPSSYIPVSSVLCKLVSFNAREGQLEGTEKVQQPPHAVKAASPYLIIHLHGSGYVCVSSSIHKVYLNDWAKKLDAPILSIYHSLAPEAPYPRPLEECLYAYAWAIKNCHRLGSTGEKICIVGCSAGGNLVTTLIIKAIQLGIRIPDGIVAVCPSVTNNYLPSPSNLLLIMDPLVPLEFILSCLEAYVGNPRDHGRKYANRVLDDASNLSLRVAELNRNAGTVDPLKLPVLVSDEILAQFPPTRFVASHRDPFLDNLVLFLKRMKALGKDFRLDLLGNLVHGFLNFSIISEEAHDGSLLCVKRIKEVLQMPSYHIS